MIAVPPAHSPAQTALATLASAFDAGFALAGIVPAAATGHRRHIEAWLAERRHGEMTYLEDPLEVRLDPSRLLPDARSVVVVADAYAGDPSVTADATGGEAAPRGRIARYGLGDDYHKVLKRRLHALADRLRLEHPGAACRSCVDTAPLLEREHAAHAGLGWIGKHTLLIHPRHGSYLLLGAIVTNLELQPTGGADARPPLVTDTDRCGTCTRCIDACPTGCIFDARLGRYPSDASPSMTPPTAPPPRAIDASKCISYLTIEHRSAIDPALHAAMGDWLIGCDVCQEVCPYNAMPEPRDGDTLPMRHPLPVHPRYRPRPELARGLDPFEVLRWTEDNRRAVFRGSALKRVKLDMLHRNALIVLTNHAADPDAEPAERDAIVSRLQGVASDASRVDLVRDTALAGLERLGQDPSSNPPR